jgi:penicillin-binding protein 1A
MWRLKIVIFKVLLFIKSVLRFISKVFDSLVEKIKMGAGGFRSWLEKKPKARAALLICALPLLSFLILLTVVLLDTPGTDYLRRVKNPIGSEVYTADSVLIGRYFIQDRTQVQFKDISPVVIKALISTEDVRFFEHSGVDYLSLGRVLIKSILLQNESSGGGSTITQQLAKNLFPRKEYWVMSMLVNKLREAVIARRMEKLYSKEDIITLYLNTIPFGDNTYGIQAASRRFFSSNVKDLSLEQAAVLIGMLKATHYYNPRLYPHKSLKRRNVVLAQMRKYDFIDPAMKDSAQSLPLKLQYSPVTRHTEFAPYFREYLRQELEKWCANNMKSDGTPYNLYTDGLKVYTTIDSKLQNYAEKAVEKQMREVQQQFVNHWGNDLWKDKEEVVLEAVRRTTRYKALKEKGLPENQIMAELGKKISTRLFSWDGEQEAEISPIDSVKHHLQFLNAGFIAMEPGTGAVKAWVGGINHDFFQFDHVKSSTKRQVGSIFKPIVYANALEQGISPCEFISAGQETYTDDEGDLWTPRNSQYDYPLDYSMRGALAYSVNTVSVKLIQRSGIQNTIDLARKMGITSEMPDVPSIALGSSAISLMEMIAAYSTFVNEGVPTSPFYISEIHDHEGKIYNNFKPVKSGKPAISKETSIKVRHMLQSVVQEGTASRLRWKYGVYNDVAGKTGTTQANADGWFMALTPNLVMGSWVGADDPRIRFRDTNLGQGSSTALPITAYFLKNINEDKSFSAISDARFPSLPGTIRREMNCDLYEINDNLWVSLEKKVHSRDSIMMVDTLATPPAETFLETLYKRKRKIQLATQQANETHAMLTNDRAQ